jgi:hypothetical protein
LILIAIEIKKKSNETHQTLERCLERLEKE